MRKAFELLLSIPIKQAESESGFHDGRDALSQGFGGGPRGHRWRRGRLWRRFPRHRLLLGQACAAHGIHGQSIPGKEMRGGYQYPAGSTGWWLVGVEGIESGGT